MHASQTFGGLSRLYILVDSYTASKTASYGLPVP